MKAFCYILCGLVASGATLTPLCAAPAKAAGAKPAAATDKPYEEHIVKRGETLWSIAQSYNTSVGEVMDYNRLPNQDVKEGSTLKIPKKVAAASTSTASEEATSRNIRQHIHVVEDGETFWTIADDYGVSSEGLAKANPNINPNRLHPDMELIIPAEEPAATPGKEKAKITNASTAARTEPTADKPKSAASGAHTVTEGETFYSIGKKYGVTSAALIAANPTVKPERLQKGMQVVIPGKTTAPATASSSNNHPAATSNPTRTKPKTMLHTVRENETVPGIARMYGVDEGSLMRLNRLNTRDRLHPGDILTIPSGSKTAGPASGSAPVVQKNTTTTASAPTRTLTVDRAPVASAPISSVAPAATGGPVQSYIVSSGETAGTIAEAFGITKQQLYDYNRMDSSRSLRAGEEIMIPARK